MALKLCKDCIHAKPHGWLETLFLWSRWEFAKCTAPAQRKVMDPVSGKIKQELLYCSTARLHLTMIPNHCGVDAKFFEPKRKSI